MIKSIRYRRGLVEGPSDVGDLPELVLEHGDIPSELTVLIQETDLLRYEGTYGDSGVGDPLQYDYLLIDHDGGTTEITLYNRAITLFTTDDDTVKCIHRVCCQLDALDRPAV